jgi:PrcB C-terminal
VEVEMKMAGRKFRLLLAALAALACAAASAAGCDLGRAGGETNAAQEKAAQQEKTLPTPTPTPAGAERGRGEDVSGGSGTQAQDAGGIKTLDAGSYSAFDETFVAVVRDAETYAALRKLNEKLPQLEAAFFESQLVVAAFLGQRRTGGYGVEIAREGEGALRVSELRPPKDAMLTMALTAPYRIVSLPHAPEAPLRLLLDRAWEGRARAYKVASGEFQITGGIAGVSKSYTLGGSLRVLRLKNLATVLFDLRSEGEGEARALADAATGKVDGKSLTLARLSPGTLAPPPLGVARASGQFAQDEARLSLKLEAPAHPKVADGFAGGGQIEAEATSPPPPKREGDPDRTL